MRGHGATGGGDDVGVHRGVVETERFGLLGCELTHIAREGVAIRHAEREVRVAEGAAHVLIKKCLRHEFGDARVAAVGQRIFADPVCIFRGNHFLEQLFVGCGRAFYDVAILEPQLNTGDLVAIAVKRLNCLSA